MEYSRYEREKHLLRTEEYDDEEEAEQLKLDFFNDINNYLDTFSNEGYENSVLIDNCNVFLYNQPSIFFHMEVKNFTLSMFNNIEGLVFAIKIVSKQHKQFICKIKTCKLTHSFVISTNEVTWLLEGLPINISCLQFDSLNFSFYNDSELVQLDDDEKLFIYGLDYEIRRINNLKSKRHLICYMMNDDDIILLQKDDTTFLNHTDGSLNICDRLHNNLCFRTRPNIVNFEYVLK